MADTNVVSELMSPEHHRIEQWLKAIDENEIFTTVVTRAEVRFGIAKLPHGRRRTILEERADAFFQCVSDRTLVFDAAAADRFGEVAAARVSIGRPVAVPDGQIAAIALEHRATVATRNIRDFEGVGLKLVDPFTFKATS